VPASKLPAIVVCDAGPLIHLDELGCLDLLTIFSEIFVPKIVWQEVRRHRPTTLRSRGVPFRRVDIIPEAVPELESLAQEYSLHAGEEQALRLMGQFAEAILLTDDAAARTVARQMAYQVHGTIGVLVIGWQQLRLSKREILAVLRAIPSDSTLFVTKDFLKSVITLVRKGSP
jgi:predicted nucleic acid-binding protein